MMPSIRNILFSFIAPIRQMSAQTRAILLVVGFIMLTGNLSLFSRIVEIFPLTLGNLLLLLSLAVFFSILTAIFFLLICHGRAARWVLALFLVLASQTAYYMDQFGVIIDMVMIDNMMQTNLHEFAGLLTVSLVIRTLVFGIIPAWLVIKYFPKTDNSHPTFKSKLPLLGVLLLSIVLLVAPFATSYISFLCQSNLYRLFSD
jgi:lipid A ethanolaminephosphotransferase